MTSRTGENGDASALHQRLLEYFYGGDCLLLVFYTDDGSLAAEAVNHIIAGGECSCVGTGDVGAQGVAIGFLKDNGFGCGKGCPEEIPTPLEAFQINDHHIRRFVFQKKLQKISFVDLELVADAYHFPRPNGIFWQRFQIDMTEAAALGDYAYAASGQGVAVKQKGHGQIEIVIDDSDTVGTDETDVVAFGDFKDFFFQCVIFISGKFAETAGFYYCTADSPFAAFLEQIGNGGCWSDEEGHVGSLREARKILVDAYAGDLAFFGAHAV
ncbi:MAG: hypothetical protein A4E66_02671 [Syntrophus sp. PtaB.Bin001]|nr:MAG: hypothetical protein A4E66_02671 [Syntrophus sp. PtaB.Bin001]